MTLRSRASKAREEGEEAEGLLDNVDDQVDSGETTEEGDFVMLQKKKTDKLWQFLAHSTELWPKGPANWDHKTCNVYWDARYSFVPTWHIAHCCVPPWH